MNTAPVDSDKQSIRLYPWYDTSWFGTVWQLAVPVSRLVRYLVVSLITVLVFIWNIIYRDISMSSSLLGWSKYQIIPVRSDLCFSCHKDALTTRFWWARYQSVAKSRVPVRYMLLFLTALMLHVTVHWTCSVLLSRARVWWPRDWFLAMPVCRRTCIDYQLLLGWTKNSEHSINIRDIVAEVAPLYHAYQAPSNKPNFTLLAQVYTNLTYLSIFILELAWTAAVQARPRINNMLK